MKNFDNLIRILSNFLLAPFRAFQMKLSLLFISQVGFLNNLESYDNEEVSQQYEEAVEEGKDASNVTIDDIELLKLIGKGGYSQVFMARKKDSGQLYAIKIMDKKHLLSCMTPSAIVRECQINRKC